MSAGSNKAGSPIGASGPLSLAGFVDHIRNDPREFRSVSRAVNPMNFDVTAILQHLEDRGQFPAVEFTKVLDTHGKPSQFAILANLWATRERCAAALGLPHSQAGVELSAYFAKMVSQRIAPVTVSSDQAPVHAHVLQGEKADMFMFPAVRHAEMDLGGAFTMAVCARPPDAQFYNVTFVKTFAESPRGGGLSIHTPHVTRCMKEWEARGERMPVINILGHHPAWWLGTLNNTQWGADDYATAGAFMKEPTRLVPSVTWGRDFMVPADAEIIIEGEVGPGSKTIIDPFGEINGCYQAQEFAPLFEVTAITYRDNAICQDIFSGHREHQLMGALGHEGSCFNHLNEKFGAGVVTAVTLPYSACGRYVLYISIRKTKGIDPKEIGRAGLAFLRQTHAAIVVDDDINIYNEEQVLWAVNTYVHPDRDIEIGVRPPHRRAFNPKRIIIDATRPTNIPFPTRHRVPLDAMARTRALDEWLDSAKGK
jgi:UbiD family decarboxylase